MHIEFRKLVLHNFMSFGHSELNFSDDGFIRVSGVNENPFDNAGSNGSGKSSLWEAIIWAITGETIRGTKHVVNIYGDDGCYVDVEFYIDHNKYQLIRAKDHKVKKTSLQIFLNDQDISGKGIRDSEKLLQQYLPDITASLLGSVIILGQGLPQKFTNNTPSGRKEVLEKLSNSDFMIEDLKSRVTSRKAELTKEQRSYEDTLIELRSKKSFLEKQIQDNESLLATLSKEELVDQQSRIQSYVDKVRKTIEDLTAQYNLLDDTYRSVYAHLLDLSAQETTELQNLYTAHQTVITPCKDQISRFTAELNSLNKQLTTMRSVKDVCPTCGQKLPDVHKPDTSSIETEIKTLTESLSTVKSSLEQAETVYKANTVTIKEKYVSEKSETSAESDSLIHQLKELKTQIEKETSTANTAQVDLNNLTLKIAQLDATIENCNKIIRENTENLTALDDKIMYNNKQKDLTQSHLEVVNKFDTILKRDFRGYLLSTVIDFVEQRAKYYSQTIFDTTNVTFCLDGNNIDINYMNRAYENLSGGEKQKIDLIIQFSIRDMLSTHLGFTSNILVLDEVFDGLDSLGCNKVIDMISNLSDIKNIFIVTHRKDLSIPTDRELIVVKSSAGISEIQT